LAALEALELPSLNRRHRRKGSGLLAWLVPQDAFHHGLILVTESFKILQHMRIEFWAAYVQTPRVLNRITTQTGLESGQFDFRLRW